MRIRRLLIAIACVLVSTRAGADSKLQANIVATPPHCFAAGGYCWNSGAACTIDDSPCAAATMSPKSRISLDGRMIVRAKIFGVTDASGAPLTTGPAETATDNLVLKLTLSTCARGGGQSPCSDTTDVYLKVVVTEGRANLRIDLASVLDLRAGDPLTWAGMQLLSPAPSSCGGDNSAVQVVFRIDNDACDSGIVRGSAGVVAR